MTPAAAMKAATAVTAAKSPAAAKTSAAVETAISMETAPTEATAPAVAPATVETTATVAVTSEDRAAATVLASCEAGPASQCDLCDVCIPEDDLRRGGRERSGGCSRREPDASGKDHRHRE